jgi:hypothetical protein
MIVAGGVAQALMLPVSGIGTLYLRHRHLPSSIAPPRRVTIALWAATVIIVLLMGYYVIEQLRKF